MKIKIIQSVLWSIVAVAIVTVIFITFSHKDNKPITMPLAGFNKATHFTLKTHMGKAYNSASEIKDGEYALIFFGFTMCPSICPTELIKMADILDTLPKEKTDKLHPLFITIDPERDTVETLNNYVPQFHPKIIGLTNDTKTVHTILNDWKVYFSKVEDPKMTEYTMDHSTYSYLVDHNMNIKAVFRLHDDAQSITSIIDAMM